MKSENLLFNALNKHNELFATLKSLEFLKAFDSSSDLIIEALRNKKKLFIAGNGGSAADSQHFAAELICRYKQDRAPIPCIALTTDTSVLTSVTNDYRYEDVFTRQIQAFGSEGDVLIAISTSGNSKNILAAMETAKAKNMGIVCLTGKTGGKMRGLVETTIYIDSHETARIQEAHIFVLHAFCEVIDYVLFNIK